MSNALEGFGTVVGAIDPVSMPSAYDYIVLAGCISPGVAEVSGADVQYRWDEPQSKGSSGSDITYQGRKPATVTVTLSMWAPSHFHTWEIFRQLLVLPDGGTAATSGQAAETSTSNDLGPRFDAYPSTGTTTTASATTKTREPQALDIEHPHCAQAGIHSVVVDKVGQLTGDGSGLWKVEIVFRQYEKPKSAGGKPSGSVANGGATGGGDLVSKLVGGSVNGAVSGGGDYPNEWATVPNPDGNDYRKVTPATTEGQAQAGEAQAIAEEPA